MSSPSFSPLRGELRVPGDKSISHRAVMLGALAKGTTEITGFLPGADCLSTVSCFRAMGVRITQEGDHVTVRGQGLRSLRKPDGVLDCGNSGTTMRLLGGILAPQPFDTILTGDSSVRKRPMDRIITPLSMMGADIRSIPGNGCPPLAVSGKQLRGISYESPAASAQVKSAVLLAGLSAEGKTSVTEPALSRDHSERMLRAFGAEVLTATAPDGRPVITVTPAEELFASAVSVPGDISSAAYFIAVASLIPGSEVLIRNVGINPTRAGMIKVAKRMGADITMYNISDDAEPSADLLVRYAPLHGVTFGGSLIPALIDEIPVIAVMAAAAEGTTCIRDAAELKVKETDRIRTISENLTAMGCSVTPQNDGLIIEGKGSGGLPLKGACIHTYGDHRIAMAFSVAALAAGGETHIDDDACVDVSYPGFYTDLNSLF